VAARGNRRRGELGASQPDTARAFFALWPDDEARAALGRLGRSLHGECGGRAIPARNIHLTLVFLGNVSAGRLPGLHALAAGVVAPQFELTLDTLAYWRHNRIVWAGTANCPPGLRELVAQLVRRLGSAGFPCEEREYVPHITLLRDARRAPVAPAGTDIVWRAGDFTLVRSERRNGGVAYKVIGRWMLGAAAH
jgi:RNA 2',3'-cyclic 3'-phosphodiesterase